MDEVKDGSPVWPSGEATVYTDAHCRYLLWLGRVQGRRVGIAADCVEDCACGFVIHMLEGNRLPPFGAVPTAWLARCASNWARNYQRHLRYLQHHEVPWPQEDDPATSFSLLPVSASLAEDPLLRREVRLVCSQALHRLHPAVMTLFLQHYLSERSISELAYASGRTPAAVRQSLYQSRCRLRRLLQEQGIDLSEAQEYLHLLAPAAPRRPRTSR